jgi:hypothetical protein
MPPANQQLDNFYVYEYLRATGSANGRAGSPWYVGKGFGDRAFDKTGHYSFPKERKNIHIIADNMSKEDALQAEMLLIHFHGRVDIGTGCLRNRTDGGEGCRGAKRSDETRRKLRDKTLKEWEVKKASGYSYPPVSDETRAKFRSAKLGIKQKPDVVEKRVAARAGYRHSTETIEKIRASNIRTKGGQPCHQSV